MSGIDVTALPGERYPVQVELMLSQPESEANPTVYTDFGLTVEEARELAEQLLVAARAVEDTGLVQVEFTPLHTRYTYRDPSGTLEVGDRVTVSGIGRRHIGTVVARGRGDYTGEVYEEVTGKVVPLA